MSERFIPVTVVDELDELFARSTDRCVVVFKHDTACPISAAAYRELAGMDEDIPLVDVSRCEDVAQEITARTGVQHASPQVIVLRGGKPAWSASHFEITGDAVREALAQRS